MGVGGQPIYLESSVLVNAGATLTIEAGVTININDNLGFLINGTLIAQGTESQKITFQSSSGTTPGSWVSISFGDTSTDATFDAAGNYTGGSILQHCIIKNGGGSGVDGQIVLTSASPFIDNCEIRDGAASGINATDAPDLRINRCTIGDNGENSSGGGIRVIRDTATLTNNTITGNTADGAGGGIFVSLATVTLTNNTITGNSANHSAGGGIFVSAGAVTFTNNTISGNVSNSSGGGIFVNGGAAALMNNTITSNSANFNGGGVGVDGGTVTLTNNTINGNNAITGGGIFVDRKSTVILTDNTISENTAPGRGGGIFVNGGTDTFTDNTISDNTAGGNGGGIHVANGAVTLTSNTISGNSADDDGGGAYVSNGMVLLANNIISGNSASTGGGIRVTGDPATATLTSNTIRNNTATGSSGTAGVELSASSEGVLEGNLITGNTATGGGDSRAVYVANTDWTIFRNTLRDNNTDYEFYFGGAAGDIFNAENNYWGTTDAAAIADKIFDFFDNASRGFVDFEPFLFEDMALPVELSAFHGEITQDGIRLQWRTESETNNLGFYIYRSETKDGDYVRITPALIRGHGTDPTPHNYSFLDETAEEGQTYWYRIEDVDFAGAAEQSQPIQVGPDRIRLDLWGEARKNALSQNFPNPSNPETWIPYQLATDAVVSITIYSTAGNPIRTLWLGNQPAGVYQAKDRAAYWDGRNDIGERVSSGVYFYQLRAGDFQATRRMLIVK